ncbi:DNA helicase UvrD [Paenibacillus selenitireducens]|uniref:DNA 3'-5' helicase n=1 Tax=Paenibacillus selenitireducens TaxID=1324314 RepID=A0A1T2XD27_9BACL|nr:3'-5' exonuclease [Paenibacillus selenitireducens]OPA77728.1 DNA helicase UvrD [Paenibacillus selenitireducens]
MEDTFQSAYQEEMRQLEIAQQEIDRQLTHLRNTPVYTGHDFTEQVLEETREARRQRLARAEDAPYFGRLDFQTNQKSEATPLYIGKVGVNHGDLDVEQENPLVIDWRAPIASLFYSFTGGLEPASYEAPEGTIEGLVYLKRNLVIRKKILQRVVDTYTRDSDQPAVSDEFLLYRLGENKDNRLRDIVSTIQAEQDLIIRAAKNTALMIQGVAGSGKTTVALHRLAFLLYQYQEQIRAERMIIFAPNQMFLNYISDVLPELGVGNIQQNTFADWAMNLLDLDAKLLPATDMWGIWFETLEQRPALNDDVSGRYKGSTRFKQWIDKSMELLEVNCVPDMDFSPWDGKVLPLQTIRNWFFEEYKHYALAKRKERVLARINRWIEMELKPITNTVKLKEFKQKSSTRIKAYAKKWPEFDAFTLYKNLFQPDKRGAILQQDRFESIPADVVKHTRITLKNNEIRHEDLAGLLYIHVKLHDMASESRFDHIVIDEAQDFSPFQVAVLDLFVRNHSFTILGDLSQGIHAYQGIHDWNEMQSLFEAQDTAYFALTRSYRSTMEIIEFANGILERGVHTDLLAVPVFRSGQQVQVLEKTSVEQLQVIQDAIQQFEQSEYNTTALLTRTLEEARTLYQTLLDQGLNVNLIDGSQNEYQGGISVLPVYLSKGLEFDAVLLMDADAYHYREGAMDAKLLYVGCTRALHELWILYHGELTPFIQQPA